MSQTRTKECQECGIPVPFGVIQKRMQIGVITGNRQSGPSWFENAAEKEFVECPNCKTRYRVRKVLGDDFIFERAGN